MKPITTFTTSKGDKVTGAALKDALAAVAQDWRDNAHAIRKEDDYASHVSEVQKEENLRTQLEAADMIERGEVTSFTIAQRLNTKLTGECVALLT